MITSGIPITYSNCNTAEISGQPEPMYAPGMREARPVSQFLSSYIPIVSNSVPNNLCF